MSAFIQVIGPCTSLKTQTPSLLIQTDKNRYIINCTETFQRVFNEYKLKVTRKSTFLFTRTGYTSGLPGVLLTKRSAGLNLTDILYGPTELSKKILSYRYYYNRPETKLDIFQLGSLKFDEKINIAKDGEKEDPSVEIFPITFGSSKTSNNSFENSVFSSTAQNLGKVSVTNIPETNTGSSSIVSYFVKFKKTRGKFFAKKAIELGVRPGRDFGRLAAGESVTNSEGKLISHEQCVEKAESGQAALILDIDENYVSCLSEELSLFMKSGDVNVRIVYHLSKKDVVSSEEYKQKIFKALETENSGTKHIFLHADFFGDSFNTFYSFNQVYEKLHDIEPTLFKSLPAASLPESDFSSHSQPASDLLTYTFYPKSQRGLSTIGYEKFLKSRSSKGVVPSKRKRNGLSANGFSSFGNGPEDKVEVTFLGTGAAVPGKYRNVSSTLLRFKRDDGSVTAALLDCGEGTLYQICKKFGDKKTQDIIQNELDVVLVSHMHADHHLGLQTIIPLLTGRKIKLVGPPAFHGLMEETNPDSSIDFLDAYSVLKQGNSPGIFENIEIWSALVPHCPHAFGYLVSFNNKFKVVFSGDSEPAESLVNLGTPTGVDLLIHEATLEDDKIDEAKQKRHSTVSQAVNIGERMKAKHIILTHFSQRYPKAPIISERYKKNSNIIIAFDLMQVTDRNLEHASKQTEKLVNLFNEEDLEPEGER
eukprot:augustus_masked-scaffold_5-processed-gene-15.50-mRNA-1 protein AED:0.13 eAED:0.13 QI:0/-1/0/1/-1/1/1/0/703